MSSLPKLTLDVMSRYYSNANTSEYQRAYYVVKLMAVVAEVDKLFHSDTFTVYDMDTSISLYGHKIDDLLTELKLAL